MKRKKEMSTEVRRAAATTPPLNYTDRTVQVTDRVCDEINGGETLEANRDRYKEDGR